MKITYVLFALLVFSQVSFSLDVRPNGTLYDDAYLTGENTTLTVNCEALEGTAENVFLNILNSTDNETFTPITTDDTEPIYANVSSISLGSLDDNSSQYFIQINATSADTYTIRMQCNATNTNVGQVNSTGHNITVDQAYGFLNVSLLKPLPSVTTNVVENRTFLLSANVSCTSNASNPTAVCDNVNGTPRFNISTANPVVQINTTKGHVPFWSTGNQTCGYMSESDICNLEWTVNVTSVADTIREVDVLFTANETQVSQNSTLDANISTIECSVDFTVLWSTMSFGDLPPSTDGNPAPGNDANEYNISVNHNSCVLDLYIMGYNLTNDTWADIGVGNITWSNTTNDFSESYNLTDARTPIRLDVAPVINVTTWYWMNVPAVFAGVYSGNITITGAKHDEII